MRLRLNKFWEDLGSRDGVNSEIHLKAISKPVQRLLSGRMYRPWFNKFENTCRGQDQVYSEGHLEAVIKQVWRPSLSEFADAFEDPAWLRLNGYLEVVKWEGVDGTGDTDRYWNCIHSITLSCENVECWVQQDPPSDDRPEIRDWLWAGESPLCDYGVLGKCYTECWFKLIAWKGSAG